MNIGIRLHDTAPGTLSQRLGFARAQGFTCAHVALSKCLPDFDMADAPRRLDDALAAAVRAEFAAAGMDFAVLGCYLRLARRDAEALARTQAVYAAHLRFAAKAGARVVGTETPAGDLRFDRPAWESEAALNFFIECARPVARAAEKAGAVLAIEPVVDHIVSTPERAERVLDALGSDHVAIILDAVNLLSTARIDEAETVIDEALRRLGDRVRVLHMKDYLPDPAAARPRELACGQGVMRYEKLLRFAASREIPMTLENTTPETAEAARLCLVDAAARL